MSEGAFNGLGKRIGAVIADWSIEKTLDVVVSAAVGLGALAWIKTEWACIRRPWCEVSGWSLGLLIALSVVTAYAALFFARRWYGARGEVRVLKSAATAAPQRFHDIDVLDHKLKLRWYIRRPPREWLHWRKIAATVAPSAVQQVLDGPFHGVAGCNAPLVEVPMRSALRGSGSPQFSEICRTCGQQIFDAHNQILGVDVWPVRAYALEELQRMQRNGTKIPEAQWREPIVLERPEYWKLMFPPRAPRTGGAGNG